MAETVGFKDKNGADLQSILVPKSYMMDRYPELLNTFKTAGVWMWGSGTSGQRGDESVANIQSPVQTVSAGANWKQLTAGSAITAAIKTDGTLWTWGAGTIGQLGNNAITSRSSPVQTISGGTNWKQVVASGSMMAAIKTDGTLWLWGQNHNGQLGNNTITNRSSPVQTVSGGTNWKLVSAGYYVTVAIKTDGTLWSWGKNHYGQLGDNTITHRSSPVQTVSGGTDWKSVSTGGHHTAAIKTDGTLWVWGRSSLYGQLGDGTLIDKSSPIQTIAGGTNWKSVGAGGLHTAAIKTDGTLWTWGHGGRGQIGNGSAASQSSPVQTISGGTNWQLVSAGYYHNLTIKTDGTLWVWGHNFGGQLGIGTLGSPVYSPVQTVAGGTNWKLIAAGVYHSGAIRDDYEDLI